MEEPTVLVIEDDPATRQLLLGILRVGHFNALAAEDAIEGVRMARRQKPDLIIMDLYLPGMKGSTAAEAFVNDPVFASIPILMLSGSPEVETEAAAGGAWDWMAKPFNPAKLVSALRRLLGSRRVTRYSTSA
jgi:CheY-like chemotaxis protein